MKFSKAMNIALTVIIGMSMCNRNFLRLMPLLACLLLILSGCNQVETQSQDVKQPVTKGMTYAEQVAHDLDVARKALNEKYETDGWVWVASEVCQHGDPWSYTDKKAERVGTDGVVETVYVCNLMAKEFDPES